MTRGLRNNNPGNIRYSAIKYLGEIDPSKDTAFKQFKTIVWGYRAIFMLLHTYSRRHSLKTIKGMISRYAPQSENDTDGYVKAVSLWSGIQPDRVLNTLDGSVMIPVVSAISRMENGIAAIKSDVESGWQLFINTVGV